MRTSTNSDRRHSGESAQVLKDDVAAIKRDLTALIGSRFGAVSDRTKELFHDTSEKAKVMHKRLADVTAARPVTTILLAAAAGAIGVKAMSLMFRR